MKEQLVKSKERVQQHGEVFTPRHIVELMLDQPGIVEETTRIDSTFLEPSVGEGIFLVVLLERKLEIVRNQYNKSLTQYENFALYALSTLYGIELLEDNVLACTMNLFKTFMDAYELQCLSYEAKVKPSVLKSAQTIISANIEQGNFLTRLKNDGSPIVFSEWTPLRLAKNSKTITVNRTNYTLEDIYDSVEYEKGNSIETRGYRESDQMTLFDILGQSEELIPRYAYRACKISEVYKEEMVEIYDED